MLISMVLFTCSTGLCLFLDGESNIIIPDTPQGLVLDYVDNFVKMRFFEELMYNGEAQGAADLFKLYAQQDLVKLKNAKTELKMMGMTLKGMYETS